MITLISLIAALALAALPISIGWRRSVDEAGMARAMGVAEPRKRFDPEKFALQTGTGLTFSQIALDSWLGWAAVWRAGSSLGCSHPSCSRLREACCMPARSRTSARNFV